MGKAGFTPLVRIGRDSLSFTVPAGDGGAAAFMPYGIDGRMSMAANLREAFRAGAVPECVRAGADILVDSPTLLIPEDLFDEDQAPDLFHHAVTSRRKDAVMTHALPALGAVVAFPVGRDLGLVLSDNITDPRFIPAQASVWEHLYLRSFAGVRMKLYAHFHDRCLDAFCFAQNRFRFSNRFDTCLAADAAYYILGVWRLLGLDAGRDELHLAGSVPGGGALEAELRRFVMNVYAVDTGDLPLGGTPGVPYDVMAHLGRTGGRA